LYAIIDIETTGGSALHEKITEIAIFIHDGTQIVDEFTSLVNPEKFIPYYITQLTGIDNDMVANAPKFYEIARKIVEITENTIFVAHNASFDYGFIRSEFKQLGYDFRREKLCTVKLSRKLLPGKRSYSLGKLCSELNIQISDRHRAAGDAAATVKLFEMLLNQKNGYGNLFSEKQALKELRFNPLLDVAKLQTLPEEPGVYYFHDEHGNILYIGKSKNIKTRVMSHLHNSNGRKATEMKDRIADISYELTGNELIALLLESDEIKKHKPLYNRAQRRALNQYGLYPDSNADGYITLNICRNNQQNAIPVVTFNNKKEATAALSSLVEKYYLCQKLCGLYKSEGACFHHQIMQCRGACLGLEDPELYNERVEKLIRKFSYNTGNMLITDCGRNMEEMSAVLIQHGKYIGFGYFNPEYTTNPEMIKECIKPYHDNHDVKQILRNYIHTHPQVKIVNF